VNSENGPASTNQSRLIDGENKFFVRAEGTEPAADCTLRLIFRNQNERRNDPRTGMGFWPSFE
jgi:hypothetical protein